jgi:sugar phosphate permease
MTYFEFIKKNSRFTGFGIITMAFSGFGQTYVIALYNNQVLQSFDLSKSDLGLIYSIATLSSGLLLMWSGLFVDRMRLSYFTSITLFGLITSCFLMAFSSNIVTLFLALFMLRHFGQGLCTHTSGTAIARAYNKNRGRALALAQTGLPLSEGLYPIIVVFLILNLGWQQSWLVFGLFLLFIGWPLVLWLGKAQPVTSTSSKNETNQEIETGMSRMEVLKDWAFYPFTLFVLTSPLLLTGIYFQHTVLVAERGWDISTLASAFMLYAVIKVLISLFTGFMIDRFSAVNVLPFTAIPIIGAYIFLLNSHALPETLALFCYMSLVGMNVGSTGTCGASLWPELYGTKFLGSIKSLTGAFFIFATSLAPWVSGILLDSGWTFDNLVGLSLAITMFTLSLLLMTLFVKRGLGRQTETV